MDKERTGLRIRSEKNVSFILKKAFLHFARWLRHHYIFPKRVIVYVKANYFIINRSKECVLGTFFGPFDKKYEPYIRIATGDFYDLEKMHGRRDAILMILNSLSHELLHYYQWLQDDDFFEKDEEFLEDNAENGADKLILEYIEDGFEEFWSSLDGEL